MSDITLDRRAFKALASESRVNALKALKKRRKTLSELAKELGLGVSTTKEHMQNLQKVGLVILVDEGRKWKYYELTSSGLSVISPEQGPRITLLLGTSLVAVVGSVLLLFNKLSIPSERSFAASTVVESADVMSAPLAGAAEKTVEAVAPVAQLPLFEISLVIVAILFLVYVLVRKE